MSINRLVRIGKELQKEISQVIQHELNDPRIGFVSITKVKPASDLKSARVYVSVFGPPAKRKQTFNGLMRARGYIQKVIGERIKLRYLPTLMFFLDDSIDKQFAVSELLKKDQKNNTPEDPEVDETCE
ncbi:MAG: 30S ribosome-binding factor RbfA [Planctomycetes bacterium]|nr:30S ribosome-binding factor RbfA [Planctomycetota bacterium]MCK5579039.1 30S ribosome-binding factor RbfA [Planctomycetota bacterium]